MNAAVVAITTMLMVCTALAHPVHASDQVKGNIVHVINDDTFLLKRRESGPVCVRLWRINIPERYDRDGTHSAKVLESIIDWEGSLLIRSYRHTDRHARVVAQCSTANGTDLGRFLVITGAARDCPRYSNGYYASFETAVHAVLPVAGFCRRK